MWRWSTSSTVFFLLVAVAATLFHQVGFSWHGNGSILGERASRGRQGVTDRLGVQTAYNGSRDGGSLLNRPSGIESGEIDGFPPVCEDPEGERVEAIRLDVTGTRFRCTESQCEHHYDNCIVEIDYELRADTRPDLSLEASVSCHADITYGTGHGYILTSSSDSKLQVHRLQPRVPDAHHLSMCFTFSSYEEVITAQLDSVKCRIKEVELQ